MTTTALAATDLGITGPYFLTVYVMATFVAYLASHRLRTAVLKAATPSVGVEALGMYRELSPGELGYLEAGPRRALLAALGTLADRGIVDAQLRILRPPHPTDRLEPLASAVAARLHANPAATPTTLIAECAGEIAGIEHSLQARSLVHSRRTTRRVRLASLPLLACAAVGIVRIVLGASADRPVAYLVVVVFVTVILACWFARRPEGHPLADRILAYARNDMAHLSPEYRPAYHSYGPYALPSAVALFGLPVLAFTWPELADNTQVMVMGAATLGGGGGGCGSSGSACSSSCGGGGCGGGCGG